MINLLLGAPGGGKSYEATAFHVMPALESGRKVITNLPLNVAEIQAIIPDAASLLVVVTESKVKGKLPFSVIEDWKDDWKNEKTGVGALFIVDECHQVIPRAGTQQEIVEFAALHRHTGCDWLLMTQDHGKLNKDIKALVQLCYVVRKNIALGKPESYTRSVYDGLKTSGASNRVSQQTREYNPAYFRFYKSHTLASSAVIEENAKDVTPTYKKYVYGGVAMALAAPLIGLFIYFFGSPDEPPAEPQFQTENPYAPPRPHGEPLVKEGTGEGSARMSTPEAVPVPVASATVAATASASPMSNYQLRLMGVIRNAQKSMALFTVESNGVPQYQINNHELQKAGYSVALVADCIVTIQHASESSPQYVHCGTAVETGRSSLRESVDVITPAPAAAAANAVTQAPREITIPDSRPNLMTTPEWKG